MIYFLQNYHTHGVILSFQNGKKLTVQNEHTLGGRIEFARMTLAHECEKAYKRRKLQRDHKKLKCKDQLYCPSKFGCDPKPPKPKKKFKAKKFKGKKLKKKAKPS